MDFDKLDILVAGLGGGKPLSKSDRLILAADRLLDSAKIAIHINALTEDFTHIREAIKLMEEVMEL